MINSDILVNTWLALTTGPSTFCSITGQDKEEFDVKNHHLKCSRWKVEKTVLMWMCSGFLLMKLLHNADLMTAEPLQTWYLQKSPQCLEKERGRERRDVPLLVVAEQHGDGGGLDSLWLHYRTFNRIQTPTINEVFLSRTGRMNVDTRGSFLTVLELKWFNHFTGPCLLNVWTQ